jgi:DNA-directed RNA polymerase subunit RPC12/RpoP
MSGNCPKCGTRISKAKAASIKLEGPQTSLKGVSYSCPSCSSILSVEVDPFALVAEIEKRLKK